MKIRDFTKIGLVVVLCGVLGLLFNSILIGSVSGEDRPSADYLTRVLSLENNDVPQGASPYFGIKIIDVKDGEAHFYWDMLNDQDALNQLSTQLLETGDVSTTAQIEVVNGLDSVRVGYLREGQFLTDYDDVNSAIEGLNFGDEVYVLGARLSPLVIICNPNENITITPRDSVYSISIAAQAGEENFTLIGAQLDGVNAPEWSIIQKDIAFTDSHYSMDEAYQLNTTHFYSVVSSLDCDGDGLADGLESLLYGTNPKLGDSDGDGLSDLIEVELGLNPNNGDSDGDGISDSDEVNVYATDANDPLSDPTLLPEGYAEYGVNNPPQKGTALYYKGGFEIKGSGFDIWNYADQFEFVAAETDGDFDISCCLANVTDGVNYSRAGIMVRDSLAPESSNVLISLNFNIGIKLQSRIRGGVLTFAYGESALGDHKTPPYFIRLKRVGNVFTGYLSADGTKWDVLGSVTAHIRHNAFLGFVVNSMQPNKVSTARFEQIAINKNLNSPMIFSDGTVLTENEAKVEIERNGSVVSAVAKKASFPPSEKVHRYLLDSTYTNGLRLTFYETSGNIIPDFSTCKVIGNSLIHCFDADPTSGCILGSPVNNNFGFETTGQLFVPETGEYTFKIRADDQAHLIIDNELVLDVSFSSGIKTARVNLSEGVHDITFRYIEGLSYATCLLWWSSDKIKETTLSTPYLFHKKTDEDQGVISQLDPLSILPNTTAHGLLVKYYNLSLKSTENLSIFGNRFMYKVESLLRIESCESLERVLNSGVRVSVAIGINGYLYVPEDGAYTFYLSSDDGAILNLNNMAIILRDERMATGTTSVQINLKKGYYLINVDYFNAFGNGALLLEWSSPLIPRQMIASDFLSHNAEDVVISQENMDEDGDGLSNKEEIKLGT